MNKNKNLVHETFNQILTILSHDSPMVPSELSLSQKLEVSRTVIRKAFDIMVKLNLIQVSGRKKALIRIIRQSDYFLLEPDQADRNQIIQQFFVNQIRNGSIRPGVSFSVLDLATESGCNRTIVREFLYKFSKFGLIEKRPRKMWGMVRIDRDYVAELTETRKRFEVGALESLWDLPGSSPAWSQIKRIALELVQLSELAESSINESQVWKLDEVFHQSLIDCQSNRFLSQFYSTIYFVFTLHYQWCLSEGSSHVDLVLAQSVELSTTIIQHQKKESRKILDRHCDTARDLFFKAIEMLSFP